MTAPRPVFRRMVVAVDDEPLSDAAIDVAFELAVSGTVLRLVHVLEVSDRLVDDTTVLGGVERLIELSEDRWRGRLAAIARRAPSGVRVRSDVLLAERASEAVVELAERDDTDVVVSGTHGTPVVRGVLLGSVSQRLLEHAPCSVLLVGARPPLDEPRMVVAGVDGSEATALVVALAVRAAQALGAQLMLVCAAEAAIPAFFPRRAADRIRAAARERALATVRAARSMVTASRLEVTDEIHDGAPGPTLTAICDARRPVLAVVGHRGRHAGVAVSLLGSTARHLVHHAPCPVLVVRSHGDAPGPEGQRV